MANVAALLGRDGAPEPRRASVPCQGCGGSRLLKLLQPEGANGSPEPLIDRGVGAAAQVVGGWIAEMRRAIPSSDSPSAIRVAIDRSLASADVDRFVEAHRATVMQGVMLGALDSLYEANSKDQIAAPEFEPPKEEVEIKLGGFRGMRLLAATRLPGFVDLPYEQAYRAFSTLNPVTRKVYDALDEKARRTAFTVANASRKKMVRLVQRELAYQIAAGADLRNFERFAAARLERAGWTPLNPSHLENVFRTNVARGHAAGKWEHSMRPTVRRLRPFVQWVGVQDGPPRQRPEHGKAHGLVMRIDNAEWNVIAPPAGWQCRCKTRTLPATYSGAVVVSILSLIPGLIDKGFTAGVSNLMDAA